MDLQNVNKQVDELENKLSEVENMKKSLEEEKKNLVILSSEARHDSVESKALRYFGVSSVKDLLQVNTNSPIYSAVPLDIKLYVKELKRDFDVARMISQIFHGEEKDTDTHIAQVKGILDTYYGKNVLTPKLKAFGSTVSGSGAEWVATAVSAQYIEEYQLDLVVGDKFRSIDMPASPFKLPVQKDLTQARIQSEGISSSLTAANFGTGSIDFTAVKLAEYMPIPEELNEDSAPQILNIVREEVVKSQFRAIENAIINGDNSAVHMDADVTSSEDARKAWKGLRKLALDNSANGATVDFSAGAVTAAKLRAMRARMGKFGVNVRELAFLVSPKVYQQMMALDEVSTVDKFGQMATILSGALTAFDGVPIVITEYMRDDVDATGVRGASGNNKSVCILVNHRRFYLGVRRPVRVRAIQNPVVPSDSWLIGSWWRGDFKGHPQSATEVSTVLGINIA